MQKIMKLSELLNSYPKSKSALYLDIKNQTFPSQISLGARSIGFLTSEVTALINARVAGKTESEIRALVIKLELERQENN
jgi:prophage regulatory protein